MKTLCGALAAALLILLLPALAVAQGYNQMQPAGSLSGTDRVAIYRGVGVPLTLATVAEIFAADPALNQGCTDTEMVTGFASGALVCEAPNAAEITGWLGYTPQNPNIEYPLAAAGTGAATAAPSSALASVHIITSGALGAGVALAASCPSANAALPQTYINLTGNPLYLYPLANSGDTIGPIAAPSGNIPLGLVTTVDCVGAHLWDNEAIDLVAQAPQEVVPDSSGRSLHLNWRPFAPGTVLGNSNATPDQPLPVYDPFLGVTPSASFAINGGALNLNPAASGTLGGVESSTAPSNQFATGINSSGNVTYAQPGCGNLTNAAPSCATDTTDAANISSGTLPGARGGTGEANTGATLSFSGAAVAGAAGQLPGSVTNDTASAGNVGEYVSGLVGSGSAVALTTATPTNITSISLTAGTWDVSGTVALIGGSTTTVSWLEGGISTASATIQGGPQQNFVAIPAGATILNYSEPMWPTPIVRLTLAATTTVYLVNETVYGTNTASAFGFIRATRVR